MMVFHRLVSTALGIGNVGRGGGSIAAIVSCFCWWMMVDAHNHLLPFIITSIIILLGIWSADEVEKIWGKDNQRVVIDEVAGMCVSLLWIPIQLPYLLIAFLLFRVFDIAKPFFIKKVEKLPGGWGVMLDDVLAGMYANLLLQLIVATNFLSNVHFY